MYCIAWGSRLVQVQWLKLGRGGGWKIEFKYVALVKCMCLIN